jgi:hypothetical protein
MHTKGKTHDVYAFWVFDVPSLRRRALKSDEEHGTQSPKYSKHSCSMHTIFTWFTTGVNVVRGTSKEPFAATSVKMLRMALLYDACNYQCLATLSSKVSYLPSRNDRLLR